MENADIIVNDSWSRFHHLENLARLGYDALGPSGVDLSDIDSLPEQHSISKEEWQEIRMDSVESRIIEQNIARTVFGQTIVSVVYGTFEHSIIRLLAEYVVCIKKPKPNHPGQGQTLNTQAIRSALLEIGFDLSSLSGIKEIQIAEEIRHNVLHRSGWAHPAQCKPQLAAALKTGFPISTASGSAYEDLVQIEVDDSFVWHLLDVCKKNVDSLHRKIELALEGNPPAVAT